MRDDDVRLSERERVAFEELAHQFAGGHTDGPRRGVRGSVLRVCRSTVTAVVILVAGAAALVVALLVANVAIGAAALAVLLVALSRLTRRWNWARVLLWWRRRPPDPPPHMWEP